MRVRPRVLALLVGAWGLAMLLLGRDLSRGGCPLGSCPACGACLPRRPSADAAEDVRLG